MPPIARIGSLLLTVALAVAPGTIAHAQVLIPEPNDGPLTRVWLDASRRGTPPNEISPTAPRTDETQPHEEKAPPVPPFETPQRSPQSQAESGGEADSLVTPATRLEEPGKRNPVSERSDQEPKLLQSSKAIPLRRPQESGQTGEENSDSGLDQGRGTGISTWLTVGSSLAVVLGLFFVFAWVVRRGGGRATHALPKEAVEVLGRAPLAPRQHIHLIRCGNKVILVAVSPEHAEPLAEITEPDEVDRLTGLCRRALPGSASLAFQRAFRDLERSSA